MSNGLNTSTPSRATAFAAIAAPCLTIATAVIISGVEYPLSDPDNEQLWRYFIYHVDSTTKLGVDDEKGHLVIANQYALFPNPAASALHIRNTLGNAFQYTISNAAGQIVLQGAGGGKETTVDMRGLVSASYVITITSKDGQRFSEKFVKQ